MKKIISLVAIAFVFTFVFSSFAAAETREQSFIDVHNSFWAKKEVTQLVDEGVINGYPDRHFRPSVELSRGQAANLLSNALELPVAAYQPVFSDVSSQSSFRDGVMSTYAADIFNGKPDGKFGVVDVLTREQMASVLVRAFELKDTGETITFTDQNRISESHRYGVKVLAQHGITTGKEDGSFDPKTGVNRGTFAVFLHRALLATGQIEELADFDFEESQLLGDFLISRNNVQFVKVPLIQEQDTSTFIRSHQSVVYQGDYVTDYGYASDHTYEYRIAGSNALIQIVQRQLSNGDYFLFTKLKNPSTSRASFDLVTVEGSVAKVNLNEYDKYPIRKNTDDTFGYDLTTYPKGMLTAVKADESVEQTMYSRAYRSRELKKHYPTGYFSVTRELIEERDSYSSAQVGSHHITTIPFLAFGRDEVDYWSVHSETRMFSNDALLEDWMLESAVNYRKRNAWYTANGPFNKMAVTVEPLPVDFRAYGRNLLLVKEDRVLNLYQLTRERYYENLLYNSFINLQKFKGSKTYWETEVTSTYLKNLYEITAPFIDTRFNEQIALFLYRSGKDFPIDDSLEALQQYADLLVSQEQKGNIIRVDKESFYISDYFPIAQEVRTHSSMNHVLGGMNILLTAYLEFGDAKYLESATAIQNAIRKEQSKWIRPDGDIWYKVSPERTFSGRDYQHLTVEDLINSYELWSQINTRQLPTLEAYIKSKTGYLSANNLGYTTKMKNGLQRIGMTQYLPKGPEFTDAN